MPVQETESVTLPVIGMTCAACQHHVESALKDTAGVKSAHVDLMANRANIVFDPSEASAEKLIAAVRSAGYDAVLPHSTTDKNEAAVAKPSGADAKAIATLVAGALAMLFSMPLGTEMGPIDRFLMDALPWLYRIPHEILRWSLLAITAVLVACRQWNLCCGSQGPAAWLHQHEYAR
jgi:P-type Cu+ transporter